MLGRSVIGVEFSKITCYIGSIILQASIAQSVERRSRKAQANGSIPFAGSRK